MTGIIDSGRCRSWRCRGVSVLAAAAISCLHGPAQTQSLGAIKQPVQTAIAADASPDVQRLEAWIVSRGDAGGAPFLIVDKVQATAFAFDSHGVRIGATPVLLGLARGDYIRRGTNDLKLSAITPVQRITPAGRFVARLGEDLAGKQMLWIDYAAGIAMHAVVTSNAAEHRLKRLATKSVADNRISYGCINVPADFFETIVRPLFAGAGGIVYVLPETRTMDVPFFRHGAASDRASTDVP